MGNIPTMAIDNENEEDEDEDDDDDGLKMGEVG